MREFVDIPGYEGKYQINKFGDVLSLNFKNINTSKIMKPSKDSHGYLRLGLRKNGRYHWESIHRLVALTFIPNPNNLPEVNHKDEDKTNNCIDNLEWCTRIYNINYGTSIKRMATKHSKSVLCIELNKSFPKIKDAAKYFGIDESNISRCCDGKRNTTAGYHWKWL